MNATDLQSKVDAFAKSLAPAGDATVSITVQLAKGGTTLQATALVEPAKADAPAPAAPKPAPQETTLK